MVSKRLVAANIGFVTAVFLHAADHIDRGVGSLSRHVLWGGSFLLVFQLGSLAFSLRGHPKAPLVAGAVGFGTAVSTSAAHLAPHWSAFSNPYPDLNLGAFSWAVMLAEIATGLVLGLVALQVARRHAGAPASS